MQLSSYPQKEQINFLRHPIKNPGCTTVWWRYTTTPQTAAPSYTTSILFNPWSTVSFSVISFDFHSPLHNPHNFLSFCHSISLLQTWCPYHCHPYAAAQWPYHPILWWVFHNGNKSTRHTYLSTLMLAADEISFDACSLGITVFGVAGKMQSVSETYARWHQ